MEPSNSSDPAALPGSRTPENEGPPAETQPAGGDTVPLANVAATNDTMPVNAVAVAASSAAGNLGSQPDGNNRIAKELFGHQQHQHQHQPSAAPAGLPPRVQLHTAWPGQPAPDPKTRTAVLYMEAWGWEAWRRWCDMAPAERSAGGYTYLESFKLLLRDRGAAGGEGGCYDGEEQQLDTVCPLPAGLTAVQVAADFLGAMRRYILAHLQCCQPLGPSLPAPHPDLLLWCLTLSAMWGEADKARVREAARRAGLARTLDSPYLLLTLEPEAAAVAAATAAASESAFACADVVPPGQPPPVAAAAPAGSSTSSTHQHTGGMLLLRRLAGGTVPGPASSSPYSAAHPAAPRLSAGDTLLVVDCGGGTVDVTLHSVMGAGGQQQQQGRGGGPRLADARQHGRRLWSGWIMRST